MEKDNNTEDADLSIKNGEDEHQGGDQQQDNAEKSDDQQQSDDQQDDTNEGDEEQDGSDGNYQAKLNATNRFLKKEGYVFKDGKWQKPSTPQQDSSNKKEERKPASASLTEDEAIFIARGHSKEELQYARKVAQTENCGILEAAEKDLFKDWKARQDKLAKDRQAQLGASKGGGRSSSKKTFSTKGLSDQEHKELFQEKFAG